jgi:cation:H+ antiporter
VPSSLWPLLPSIGAFALGTLVIAVAGTRLTSVADRLADRTGLGEAFIGGVVLGAITSLPGITASVTAALDGFAALSLSNAIGGIAAQTAFLAIADISYRRANLEHAAASVPNMMNAGLLMVLLCLLLLAMLGPSWTVLHVHPLTPALFAAYGFGLLLVRGSREAPMWQPRRTQLTRPDEPDEPPRRDRTLARLLVATVMLAVPVALSGWVLTRAGESIAHHTGLAESVVGALFIAVATSLPELVTSIAAVRQGALTLAVGGILGGNAFDTLFAAVADVAYRDGSIYAAATEREPWLVASTLLMTAVLLLGMLRRERLGIARIGFESFLVLVLYGLQVLTLALWH